MSAEMYTVQSPCNDNWHINAQTFKPVHVGNCVKRQTNARRSDASCNMKLLEGCVVGLNGHKTRIPCCFCVYQQLLILRGCGLACTEWQTVYADRIHSNAGAAAGAIMACAQRSERMCWQLCCSADIPCVLH